MRKKPPAEYYRNRYQANKEKFKAKNLAYYQANREKIREYQRAYTKANPERVKGWRKKNKELHGPPSHVARAKELKITTQEYERLISRPCDICGDEPRSKHGVDHNHETGEIRGTLCVNCNVGIGHFEEDTVRMRDAIRYLNRKAPFWPRDIWNQSKDVKRYIYTKMTKESLPSIAAVLAIMGMTQIIPLAILIAAVPLGIAVDATFYYALKRTKGLKDGANQK